MYKTFLRFLFLFLFLTFYNINNYAQQRFRAGIILGLNAAQIDGDQEAGFNKAGFTGGLRVITILTDKLDLSLDFLYSQEGSRSKPNSTNSNPFFKISLAYINLPILINYKDWYIENGDYYRVEVNGGLAYGRLIKAFTEDLVYINLLQEKDNLNLVLGVTYYFNWNIGASFRWNSSLTPIYQGPISGTNARALRGKFLTFSALYLF